MAKLSLVSYFQKVGHHITNSPRTLLPERNGELEYILFTAQKLCLEMAYLHRNRTSLKQSFGGFVLTTFSSYISLSVPPRPHQDSLAEPELKERLDLP